MRKQRFMDLSMFICPECGKQFPLMRNHGQQRERGHKKDIWCPFCKAERTFNEVRRTDCYENNGKFVYM